MTLQRHSPRSNQHGVVLVTSLLLLLVVTIMALSMFRSFGIQEKIAGNVREKQRAVQAAVSAQQYAEWWLGAKSNAPVAVSAYAAASADVSCISLVSVARSAAAGVSAPPVNLSGNCLAIAAASAPAMWSMWP